MKKTNIRPVFIFCLPRSGSTLLQRLISSHTDISTVSEPWVLLPFLYPLKEDGIYSEYYHSHMHCALDDFIKNLPNNEEDYLKAVNLAAMELYRQAADDSAVYFLDKTPRYHLICDDIIKMFPEGKFIFLWRNPLAIASSIIETWGKGKWNLFNYKIDTYDGIDNLTRSYKKNRGISLSVNYESFITDMDSELRKIFKYLELEYEDDIVEKYRRVILSGVMGDPSGINKYSKVSEQPLGKWKNNLNNHFRKSWCKSYIKWIGDDRLSIMGYTSEDLLADIEEMDLNYFSTLSDLMRSIAGEIYCLFDPFILFKKIKMIGNYKMIKRYK